MSAYVWMLALVAGFLTLTMGQNEEERDASPDDEDAIQLLNIIEKSREPRDYHAIVETDSGRQPLYLSWKDCGRPSDVVHIQSFSLSPDPLRLPGNVTVGFKWQTTVDLKSPIRLDLKLEKKIGIIWIKVPCGRIPGSCHHANICADLAPFTCPKTYEMCHCPFKRGTYTLPPTTLLIQRGGVPSGDYRLTMWLKLGKKELGCLHMQLAVA